MYTLGTHHPSQQTQQNHTLWYTYIHIHRDLSHRFIHIHIYIKTFNIYLFTHICLWIYIYISTYAHMYTSATHHQSQQTPPKHTQHVMDTCRHHYHLCNSHHATPCLQQQLAHQCHHHLVGGVTVKEMVVEKLLRPSPPLRRAMHLPPQWR